MAVLSRPVIQFLFLPGVYCIPGKHNILHNVIPAATRNAMLGFFSFFGRFRPTRIRFSPAPPQAFIQCLRELNFRGYHICQILTRRVMSSIMLFVARSCKPQKVGVKHIRSTARHAHYCYRTVFHCSCSLQT